MEESSQVLLHGGGSPCEGFSAGWTNFYLRLHSAFLTHKVTVYALEDSDWRF